MKERNCQINYRLLL